MRLNEKYKQILDGGFKRHFPGWDELSPLDPVKMIAESITASLSDIEKQHDRYVDTVLDSLPSLFNFNPKQAQPETALFIFSPNQSLGEPKKFAENSVFKVQNDKAHFHIAPIGIPTVYPLSDLTVTNKGKTVELTLSSKAATAVLGLTFLADADNWGIEIEDYSLFVRTLSNGETKTYFKEDLSLDDSTRRFSCTGGLTFALRHSKQFLTDGPAQFRLTLTFGGAIPLGQYLLNAIKCAVFREEADVFLGLLKGEPWEHIALTPEVLSPPDEIQLQYPDDSTLTLHRVESDLLKLRHTETERFRAGYFYNASTHSLVLPGSVRLFRNFTGAIRVVAPRLVTAHRLPSEWGKAQIQVGEFASILDKILPHDRVLSEFIPRESNEQYLRRFYTAMRLFAQGENRPNFPVAQEIIARISALDPLLRSVEVDIDPATRKVTVYLLIHGNEQATHPSLPPEVSQKCSELLNSILPLEYEWALHPFQPIEVEVDLTAELLLEEDRQGLVLATAIADRLSGHLSRLLTPEMCAPMTKVSISSLMESLKRRLCDKLEDHTELLESEVSSLKALVLTAPKKQYVEALTRKAGEWFIPRVSSHILLNRGDSAVSSPARYRHA